MNIMNNLPNKNRDIALGINAKIIGVVASPPTYAQASVTFSVQILREDPTENSKYLICEIDAATPQGIADQIANSIREARDIGFEQGRQYVREALGIK